MWIMIVGPYRENAKTQAEQDHNLAQLNRYAYEVFQKGHTPIVPVNMALPMIEAMGPEYREEIIMPLSLSLIDRCDAVLRVGGESRCAEYELKEFKKQQKTIYHSLEEIEAAEAA